MLVLQENVALKEELETAKLTSEEASEYSSTLELKQIVNLLSGYPDPNSSWIVTSSVSIYI